MLAHLLIKNYALIEQTELAPDRALNIITGETGAGKSIMLGAVGLLMGNRADTKILYNPDEKCVIEGSYDISGYVVEHIFEEEDLDYSTSCVIRREISPSGKSRAFVNDTPVNLDTLRRITSQLMDVHSQHDSSLLGSNEYQLQIVDTYAGNEETLKRYRENFKEYRQLQTEYDELRRQAGQIKKEFDYNHFLFQELAKAKLQPDEQDVLEQELNVLENATEVREKLQLAYQYLDDPEQSIIAYLKNVLGQLNGLSKISQQYEPLRERIQSGLIEFRDLADEINAAEEVVDIDDKRAEETKGRLNTIYNLQQKHQVRKVIDLLDIQAELERKVSMVLNSDADIETARQKTEKAKEKMMKAAQTLTKSREAVLKPIEKQIHKLLTDLGMPNAALEITNQTSQPTSDGTDAVSFLFSANKGIKPQQLKNVASGGEFSRLMMALKYILATKRKLPTIVFDEIDTGVSGEIAIKMGNMMLDMARTHQVIAITHLHQIAAQGTAHYFVYKDHSAARTVSRIRKLSFEERVTEIAQMIGGRRPSETILQNARELLNQKNDGQDLSQIKLF